MVPSSGLTAAEMVARQRTQACFGWAEIGSYVPLVAVSLGPPVNCPRDEFSIDSECRARKPGTPRGKHAPHRQDDQRVLSEQLTRREETIQVSFGMQAVTTKQEVYSPQYQQGSVTEWLEIRFPALC